jgi:hypothetical protein
MDKEELDAIWGFTETPQWYVRMEPMTQEEFKKQYECTFEPEESNENNIQNNITSGK